MKVYRTDEIRNVVLLGHGGSGKTSLVEAMAYVSGATNRMGKVADKNTISDFDKEEQKRGFSLSTTLTPIEWEKAKINVLDTPGYFDFVGEVEEAVSAADAAVIVVSGKAGVEVGTEKAWALCDKYNLPRMVYVTEMDVDDASFRQVVQDLTDKFGKVIAPHFQPIRENEKLVGYVNVIKNAGRRYTGLGQREECEIPDYCKPNLEMYREKLLEAVAEISDEYMERYFAGDEFSVEEIRSAMRTEVMEGSIVPVAMGSNIQAQGVANLLSDIVRFFPSPDWRECAGINRKTNEIYEANYDFARAKSAYVFKTMVDPFIGKYSFIKVCSGVLKGDDTLYNADTDTDEKLGKIYTMFGNKPVEVSDEIRLSRLPLQDDGAGWVDNQLQQDDMQGEQQQIGRGDAQQGRKKRGQGDGDMNGEDISDGLLDVAVNAAAVPDGLYDSGEVVVHQNQIRRFPADLRAPAAHGDANIGIFERRRIVDAVPRHGDNFAVCLQGLHDAHLVLGQHAAENIRAADALLQLLLAHGGKFCASQNIVVGQADAPGDALSRAGGVSRDHDDADARLPAVRQIRLDAISWGIQQADETIERKLALGDGGRRLLIRRELHLCDGNDPQPLMPHGRGRPGNLLLLHLG